MIDPRFKANSFEATMDIFDLHIQECAVCRDYLETEDFRSLFGTTVALNRLGYATRKSGRPMFREDDFED